jgi:hypothetical protein
VCADDATKEQNCRTFLTACAAGEVPAEDCAAGGLLICGEFDGTGGAGGGGGSGGAGGGGGTGGVGGAPDPDLLCKVGVCATDAELEQLCKDAIALCLANNPNEEECVLGLSAIICLDAVCKKGVCADDATKEERCRMFLAICAAGEEPAEDCAAGGLLICHEFDGAGGTGGAPDPDVLCTGGVCADDADKEQLCKDAIALCLANTPGANEEECILGLSLIICEPL